MKLKKLIMIRHKDGDVVYQVNEETEYLWVYKDQSFSKNIWGAVLEEPEVLGPIAELVTFVNISPSGQTTKINPIIRRINIITDKLLSRGLI